MPDTISESPAEFEGGATVTKNVVFKGTGIKNATQITHLMHLRYSLPNLWLLCAVSAEMLDQQSLLMQACHASKIGAASLSQDVSALDVMASSKPNIIAVTVVLASLLFKSQKNQVCANQNSTERSHNITLDERKEIQINRP